MLEEGGAADMQVVPFLGISAFVWQQEEDLLPSASGLVAPLRNYLKP
jgi:hypothetical protein